jgi:hypothetical protein
LRKQRGRDRYADRLSRLEIDHQFVLGRRLHRQICRFLALEINVVGRAVVPRAAGLVPDRRAIVVLHLSL